MEIEHTHTITTSPKTNFLTFKLSTCEGIYSIVDATFNGRHMTSYLIASPYQIGDI